MRFIAIISFLLFSSCLYSQTTSLKGEVLNELDSTVIQGVFIQNSKSYQMEFSGGNGDFSIPVSLNDTLIFYSTSYHPYIFIVDSGSLNVYQKIYLHPNINMLSPVEIKIVKDEPIQYFDKRTKKRITLGEVITVVEHPISAIYRNFTFRGKEPDRIAARMAYYSVMDKFNYDLVLDVTKLQSDSLAHDFMEYCAFQYWELANLSTVEVYNLTSKCFLEYKNEVLYPASILKEDE